ncbi:MAG: GNAT family N-acetyltransferase [Butyribacter sp.]|nr:GNAT family N-acetyltransferase [bacterium]MDY3854348.1 GNAT family N-acetyltransferase [Butyribacter sp.]
MEFRVAQIEDFARVVSFYKYVIENTQEIEKYARWIYGQHPTDKMILNYIEQEAMYLLKKDQIIIGAMAITMSQSDDYHYIDWGIEATDDEVAVIHILCINPDYQKQGIGKRMIRESIILAKKEMKKAIRLDALASNTPALQLYQSFGFKYRGKQHLYAENTGWTDFCFFELLE